MAQARRRLSQLVESSSGAFGTENLQGRRSVRRSAGVARLVARDEEALEVMNEARGLVDDVLKLPLLHLEERWTYRIIGCLII